MTAPATVPTIRTVVVIAKEPLPGKVKTRLCPPLTPAGAAQVARAALEDTLAVVGAAPVAVRALAFDGDVSAWLRDGWQHHLQCSGTLDARLADAIGPAEGPTVLVGMDTPQISKRQLLAFDPAHYDACLGPTADGGYWAIGLREPSLAAAAIVGVPMSTEHTYVDQLDRLRGLGLRVQILEPLVDVDTIVDARLVASLAPQTRFAAALSLLDSIVEVA